MRRMLFAFALVPALAAQADPRRQVELLCRINNGLGGILALDDGA